MVKEIVIEIEVGGQRGGMVLFQSRELENVLEKFSFLRPLT